MQFREFGEWVNRISHGTERYVLFGHTATMAEIRILANKAGVSDRIDCFAADGMARGFFSVIVEQSPADSVREAQPLIEALEAAVKADLKATLINEAAEAMERGEGFRVPFESEDSEDAEPGATHPLGEDAPSPWEREIADLRLSATEWWAGWFTELRDSLADAFKSQ